MKITKVLELVVSTYVRKILLEPVSWKIISYEIFFLHP